MQYYFAPMEGITGYIYRNVHHKIFSRNRQIFFTFSLPGDEEDYDPEGASGYPAGE